MEDQKAHLQKPDFNSLTEIVERFYAIPYDQFQQELNDWFYSRLSPEQCAGELQNPETPSIGNLPTLVSEIYHRAELLSALSESKITGNEEK